MDRLRTYRTLSHLRGPAYPREAVTGARSLGRSVPSDLVWRRAQVESSWASRCARATQVCARLQHGNLFAP